MAGEWVGSVATGVVGVAGIVATWLGGKGQRDTAVSLAERDREERRALELRAQRRAVYEEVLERLGRGNFLAGAELTHGAQSYIEDLAEQADLMAELRKLQAYAPRDTSRAATDCAHELVTAFVQGDVADAIERVDDKFRVLIPLMARDLGDATEDERVTPVRDGDSAP
jgi:hypothetical protein